MADHHRHSCDHIAELYGGHDPGAPDLADRYRAFPPPRRADVACGRVRGRRDRHGSADIVFARGWETGLSRHCAGFFTAVDRRHDWYRGRDPAPAAVRLSTAKRRFARALLHRPGRALYLV